MIDTSKARGILGTTKLLTTGNPKIAKGASLGYMTAVLHLYPGTLGKTNVCPHASPGCLAGCLNWAGRGGIGIKRRRDRNRVQSARIRRRRAFEADRWGFHILLADEIRRFSKRARRLGFTPVVRLNGTSDLNWECLAPDLFWQNPDTVFYDYTKDLDRVRLYLQSQDLAVFGLRGSGEWPENYHISLSRSEANILEAWRLQHLGARLVLVYADREAKAAAKAGYEARGHHVVDGDEHDLRFLDPPGSLILLTAKGRWGKKDKTGFVMRTS